MQCFGLHFLNSLTWQVLTNVVRVIEGNMTWKWPEGKCKLLRVNRRFEWFEWLRIKLQYPPFQNPGSAPGEECYRLGEDMLFICHFVVKVYLVFFKSYSKKPTEVLVFSQQRYVILYFHWSWPVYFVLRFSLSHGRLYICTTLYASAAFQGEDLSICQSIRMSGYWNKIFFF